MKILDQLSNYFTAVKPLPKGVFHSQLLGRNNEPVRMHLRLNNDGSGILIINASTILHLNPTAAEYAYHMITGSVPDAVAKEISKRYRIGKSLALREYIEFGEKIDDLIHRPDLDPVINLGFEPISPNSRELSAPFRIDLALTYQLPNGGDQINAPLKRVERELSTNEWRFIIDKVWTEGIPHIIFTGGEPTLREDLPLLIAHAEKNGQVTGLLTDGRKFSDITYLEQLVQTGLDHLLIILPLTETPNWAILKNASSCDIFLAVHMTVTPNNYSLAEETITKLSQIGVNNLSLSISDQSMKEVIIKITNFAVENNFRIISDLPVPYSEAHPMALETEGDMETVGAGKAWLYVEPDGDVIPAQGKASHILGNILKDQWETIYHE